MSNIEQHLKGNELVAFAKELVEKGYIVFTTKYNVEEPSSWFYVSDLERITYVQEDRFEGVTSSTVHKPSKENGTGFRLSNKPTEGTLFETEGWMGRNRVEKYSGLREFLKSKEKERCEIVFFIESLC